MNLRDKYMALLMAFGNDKAVWNGIVTENSLLMYENYYPSASGNFSYSTNYNSYWLKIPKGATQISIDKYQNSIVPNFAVTNEISFAFDVAIGNTVNAGVKRVIPNGYKYVIVPLRKTLLDTTFTFQ